MPDRTRVPDCGGGARSDRACHKSPSLLLHLHARCLRLGPSQRHFHSAGQHYSGGQLSAGLGSAVRSITYREYPGEASRISPQGYRRARAAVDAGSAMSVACLPNLSLRRRRTTVRAATLGSQHGQSARHMADRTALPRQAGEAVPLAAAGPGYHAKGRQAAPAGPGAAATRNF